MSQLFPILAESEVAQERQTLLILATGRNRTALFDETQLAGKSARTLAQSTTRWRHALPSAQRQQFAQLTQAGMAQAAFWEAVPEDSHTAEVKTRITQHAERVAVKQLFLVDALLDKWYWIQHGVSLFAEVTTIPAVIVFAETRVVRHIIHEAIGHTGKVLAKKGTSLPPATAALTEAIVLDRLQTLFTPEALKLPQQTH